MGWLCPTLVILVSVTGSGDDNGFVQHKHGQLGSGL